MSKSGGNFITLNTLIEKGFDPLHYRYLCFGAHYRSQLFFSFEALEGARNAFLSLKNRILSYRLNVDKAKNPKRTEELRHAFFAAIDHDLDTPIALAVVWETMKDQSIANCEKLSLLQQFDSIMGFGVDSFTSPKLSDAQMALINEREKARLAKDWSRSDIIRDQLLEEGICLKDTKNGPQWYLLTK
jgi:cysteinyl-tRNA synthetase